MISLSDMLKILNGWGPWTRIAAAPERIDALEGRVKELESLLRGGAPKPVQACPLCHTVMRVTVDRADPLMGAVGLRQKTWTCADPSCGHTVEEQYDPAIR